MNNFISFNRISHQLAKIFSFLGTVFKKKNILLTYKFELHLLLDEVLTNNHNIYFSNIIND